MGKARIPEERLKLIERKILAAEAPADFVPELATQWHRTTRCLWKYVALVRARLAARAKAHDPDADRELIRSMALETYRTARTGGERGPDTRAMAAATRVFGDVTGVIVKRTDVTSGGKPVLMICAPPEEEPT